MSCFGRRMSAADVFEEEFFASLYDCFNPWSVSDDFYVDRAVEVGGPVLDLGCGTGMLACGIAAKGLSVTAVDPAEAMLTVARSRAGGARVTWIKSDGQNLSLGQRFRFIYMTGHAFQQLLTDDDALALLRAVAAHLNAEGRFVFETRNPAAQAWLRWTPEHSRRTIESPVHGRMSLFYDARGRGRQRDGDDSARIISCWTRECSGSVITASALLTSNTWRGCCPRLVLRPMPGMGIGPAETSRRQAKKSLSRLDW